MIVFDKSAVLWMVYDFWHNTTKNEEYRFLVATYVLKINQDGVDCKRAIRCFNGFVFLRHHV